MYIAEHSRIRVVSSSVKGDVLGATVASPAGDELFKFDSSGKHLSTVDAYTGATKYAFEYTSAGELSKITDLDGRATEIVRDNPLRPLIKGPNGQVTTLYIDASNNLTRLVGPETSYEYKFDYYSGSMLKSMWDPKAVAEGGLPYSFTYDKGLLVSDKDPRPGVTAQGLATLSETSTGQTVTLTSPSGNRVRKFETATAGGIQTRTITNPDGTTSMQRTMLDGSLSFVVGGTGYSSELTRPDGTKVYSRITTDQQYGANSPFVTQSLTVTPSGISKSESTTIERETNANGISSRRKTTTVTNGDSVRPQIEEYDGSTLTFKSTSREGRISTRTLDTLGRVKSQTAHGISTGTTIGYSTSGNGASLFMRGPRYEHRNYFADGSNRNGYLWKTTIRSSLPVPGFPVVKTFDKDALGQTLFTDFGGYTTATLWDANGNLRSLSPPGKPEHLLINNAINLLSSYRPPVVAGIATRETTYDYNADRELNTETRPDSTDTSPALLDRYTWTFDGIGRKDKLVSPSIDGAPAFSLDFDYFSAPVSGPIPSGASPGSVSAIKGPYGVNLAFEYDGSLMTKMSWNGAVSGATSWKYNNEFLPSEETVSGTTISGTTIFFGYDRDRLLTCASPTSCSSPGADALRVVFKGESMPETITLGNTTETRTYNALGELSTQVVKYGTNEVAKFLYESPTARDPLGRIVNKKETLNGGSEATYQYVYDASGRLKTVTLGATVVESYTYDGNGNRMSHSTSSTVQTDYTDAQDRWDQARTANYGNIFYGVSANGEVVSKRVTVPTAGPLTSYRYDYFGNLLTITDSGTNKRVDYLVDGKNRRVAKRVGTNLSQPGSIVKQWLYRDDLAPAAELDGAGQLIARFVYAGASNVPTYVIRNTNPQKIYRIITDQVGSPRMAINVADGADIPYQANYTAFGVQTMVRGNADWLPFGFAGGLYDPDSRMVRFGVRDFDPETGRWMSKDPIRFDGGQANIYEYVAGDPINRTDASGLFTWCEAGMTVVGWAACEAVCYGATGVRGGLFCGLPCAFAGNIAQDAVCNPKPPAPDVEQCPLEFPRFR